MGGTGGWPGSLLGLLMLLQLGDAWRRRDSGGHVGIDFDCANGSLSAKARRKFCPGAAPPMERPPRTTEETTTWMTTPPRRVATSTPASVPWDQPSDLLTVTVPATTTHNWLDSIPECSELEPGLDDMDQECKNSTAPPPIIRWRDTVFERLIEQSWEDVRVKIHTERQFSGVPLDPLRVDLLAGTEGPLLDFSQNAAPLYSAEMQMWGIEVHGLSEIYLNEILVTRDQTLSDLEMMAQFRFDSLSANGTYNINGTMGSWPFSTSFTSGGDQPFTVEITNATFTPHFSIDTSSADSACFSNGRNGDVLITSIEFPFSYDDISIMFNNLGYGYNAVINGLSLFILKTQEAELKRAVKQGIKEKLNSLIC